MTLTLNFDPFVKTLTNWWLLLTNWLPPASYVVFWQLLFSFGISSLKFEVVYLIWVLWSFIVTFDMASNKDLEIFQLPALTEHRVSSLLYIGRSTHYAVIFFLADIFCSKFKYNIHEIPLSKQRKEPCIRVISLDDMFCQHKAEYSLYTLRSLQKCMKMD